MILTPEEHLRRRFIDKRVANPFPEQPWGDLAYEQGRAGVVRKDPRRRSMIRKIIIVSVILIMAWAVTGCGVHQKIQQQLQQSRAALDTPPFEINPPQVAPIVDADVPADIRMVTAAMVQKLRKDQKGIPRVSFDSGGNHYTPETRFDYRGFSVSDISINEQWARDTGRKSFDCRVAGVMLFSDQLGRRAMVSYTADYELFRNRIIIRNSAVRPVPPIFPTTRAFIIEGSEFKEIVGERPDFYGFYTGVVSKAHSMTPTLEERREREELQKMSLFDRIKRGTRIERQENFMVIFVMDRLTPDAELEVVVTRNPNDRASLAKPVYSDFDGWRVAIVAGKFAIDHDVFCAKAYYKPSPGVLPDNSEQVMVGLFSSEKDYDTPGSPTRADVRPASHASPEGPLALGRNALDPLKRYDAALIQSRLAELGFYKTVVDGLWGPGSRRSLQAFQRAIGLDSSGNWNMQTQLKMFFGTGK